MWVVKGYVFKDKGANLLQVCGSKAEADRKEKRAKNSKCYEKVEKIEINNLSELISQGIN